MSDNVVEHPFVKAKRLDREDLAVAAKELVAKIEAGEVIAYAVVTESAEGGIGSYWGGTDGSCCFRMLGGIENMKADLNYALNHASAAEE